MKKGCLLLCLFFACIITSYSQNILSDSAAQVVAYWKKGDKKKLNFKKVIEKNNPGERKKIDSTQYSVVAEVLEEFKDGYILKWQYDHASPNETFNLLFKDYPQLSKPLIIIYRTDELGAFKEVINLPEIQAYVSETLQLLQKIIESDKSVKNASQVKEAINQFRPALTGRAGIETVMMKEIQFFHTFFGAQYSLNKKASANIELPNAFGGDPFKARIEVDLKEINKKQNSFTLEMRQFADRDQSKKIIIEILKKVLPAEKFSDSKLLEKEIQDFAIEDVCVQQVNAESCWVNWMSYKRNVTAGAHRRIETIDLTVR